MPVAPLRQLMILLAMGLVGRLALGSRVVPPPPQRSSSGIRRWAVLMFPELMMLRSLLLAMRPGRHAPMRRAHRLDSGRSLPPQPLWTRNGEFPLDASLRTALNAHMRPTLHPWVLRPMQWTAVHAPLY